MDANVAAEGSHLRRNADSWEDNTGAASAPGDQDSMSCWASLAAGFQSSVWTWL